MTDHLPYSALYLAHAALYPPKGLVYSFAFREFEYPAREAPEQAGRPKIVREAKE